MSKRRIYAIVVRHFFQLKRDLSRLADIVWYPVIDLTIWGLVSSFLVGNTDKKEQFILFFLGGIILWVFVYRMQMGLSLSLMMDMWDRNFLNLFVSPLTIIEYIIGLTLTAVFKILITFFILTPLAFFLYSFNIFNLGIYLLPFFVSLMIMGWWMGVIINGLLLRYGFKIESFAWGFVYVFNPLSGVFFPWSTMPFWMRSISKLLPSSYIFEGMRQVLSLGTVDINLLIVSFGLNLAYSVIALGIFYYLFRSSLRCGILVKLSD